MRVEQYPCDVRLTVEERTHQGRVAVPVGGAGVGARGKKSLQRVRVIVIRAKNQRGVSLGRRCLERITRIDQRLYDIRAPRACRGKPVVSISRGVNRG